jgi:D-cysteine desulfhydrase family pyridoxal phosphate-dependent enzyme
MIWDSPSPLATLPTPLERGPELNGGARLYVKRDDLTGLGVGGNKARKLEYLCSDALGQGARSLITVGAAQSNHCRMTAAAGARLGLEVHLVLSGDRPDQPTGNQLLAEMFGAHLHYTGAAASHWGELEIYRESLEQQLLEEGMAPYSIPVGGSTAVGSLGYLRAFLELMEQCEVEGIEPSAIVFTTSSGGTHAGLLAGRAHWRAEHRNSAVPDLIGVAVAKGVAGGYPDVAALATEALALAELSGRVDPADVKIETAWMGADYAVPTPEADAAILWAARNGGWVLDRVYSGKGFSAVLGLAEKGKWAAPETVVFIHTGGLPAVFSAHGAPLP